MFPPLPSTDEFSLEAYKAFLEPFECTDEDAKVKFTDEQLKELCLKHKCRVIASRWNMVHDYIRRLRADGRFEGKTEQYQRRMIAKCVMRHKHKISYDENEIQEARNTEWRARKKESILSLRCWERHRQQKDNQERIDNAACSSIDVNKDLLQGFDINTESFSMSQIDTQTQMLTPSPDIFTQEFENEIAGTSTQKEIVNIANQLMSQDLSINLNNEIASTSIHIEAVKIENQYVLQSLSPDIPPKKH